jgi:hypothetical protein
MTDVKPARECAPSKFCAQFGRDTPEYDFFYGLESGIPICCVLEFCYRRHVLKQERIALRALGVGDKTVITPKHYKMLAAAGLNFVPCAFHRQQIAAKRATRQARREYERRFAY